MPRRALAGRGLSSNGNAMRDDTLDALVVLFFVFSPFVGAMVFLVFLRLSALTSSSP